jgi:hypothetical protein
MGTTKVREPLDLGDAQMQYLGALVARRWHGQQDGADVTIYVQAYENLLKRLEQDHDGIGEWLMVELNHATARAITAAVTVDLDRGAYLCTTCDEVLGIYGPAREWKLIPPNFCAYCGAPTLVNVDEIEPDDDDDA